MRIGFGVFAVVMCSAMAQGQTVASPRLMDAPKVAECKVQEEWATPAEKSCYATTPGYEETIAYLKRIEGAASKQVRVESFGKTGEGRELDIVIASRDGVFDPATIHAAKRPVVLVQNSIHAGEMDGKDAC